MVKSVYYLHFLSFVFVVRVRNWRHPMKWLLKYKLCLISWTKLKRNSKTRLVFWCNLHFSISCSKIERTVQKWNDYFNLFIGEEQWRRVEEKLWALHPFDRHGANEQKLEAGNAGYHKILGSHHSRDRTTEEGPCRSIGTSTRGAH